jgi:hypothetical protein
MKKSLTLGLALAVIALGAVSGVSTNENGELGKGGKMPPPQTIKICKQTIPSGGTGFPFSWANGSGPLAPFTLNDGQCTTKVMTGQDHYNKFTENVPAGWTLTNISCTYTTSPVNIIGANANPAFQPGDNTVTIDLNETNVTCTFVNRPPKCCDWALNLNTGQSATIDPLWTVNGAPAYITPKVGSWMALSPAQWIQPTPAPLPDPGVFFGVYKYRVRFNVPKCPKSQTRLTGSFAADNSAKSYLDGTLIPGGSCPGPVCFNTPQAPVPLNGAPPMTAGPHLLEIEVKNASKSYSGLVVKAQVTRQCP